MAMNRTMSFRSRLPAAFEDKTTLMMFCLGMSAMLAQVVMTRELMVTFYGNELAISIIFAAWLMMISAGSLVIRPFLSRLSENSLRALVTILLVLLAAALPLLIFLARALRILFNTPVGEYLPLGQMTAGTFLVLAPLCVIIGVIFPVACRLPDPGKRNVAGIYAAESAGSMVAGMVFSFMLVFLFTPFGIAFIAALSALCGAILAAPAKAGRITCAAAILGLGILLFIPKAIDVIEWKGVMLRWEAFGILPRAEETTGAKPRLEASIDSKYQNLALIKSENQATMYGNGKVKFVFPDPISAELKISFIMAQNPFARKILLIGGNPADELPELLKYPVDSLTHVELDAAIFRLLAGAGSVEYRHAVSDPRLKQYLMDAPRFVKEATDKNEKFDVVIVEGPEPTTLALNRLYTVEFYRAISRILAPDGFFYTAVESSENLQDEAARLAASIFKALKVVFPQVLVTAGTRNQFFSGRLDATLTFDGKVLYERWRSAGIKAKYFRPEYFFNADEISAEKTDFVRRRISSRPVSANTAFRPVSAFYNLFLWSRYSSSHIESFLGWLKGLKFKWIAGGLGMILFAALLFMSAMLRVKNARRHEQSARIILAAVIATTGFSGMALELILIFMFQTFLGYIYTSIGLIIAMYMLGLALGAIAVKKYSAAGYYECGKLLLGLDALLLFIALGLPVMMKGGWYFSAEWIMAGAIYALTLLTGWAGGAQFVLANYLLGKKINPLPFSPDISKSRDRTASTFDRCSGRSLERQSCPSASGTDLSANIKFGTEKDRDENKQIARDAALLNAVDLAGAALGGICTGIIFLPLFGFAGTCYLLAILKTGIILLIGALLYFLARK
jgi:spermidine synthase